MIPRSSPFSIPIFLFISTFLIFLWSPVVQFMDSKYALLLSHSLVTRGSFKLDHYKIPDDKPDEGPGKAGRRGLYHMEQAGTSRYYYFPPGSSVLSVPFVAVCGLFGLSPADRDGGYLENNEIRIERTLAALLMAGLTVVVYLTARRLLSPGWSLLVSLGGAFGTQVMSTASRALWADTWGILLLGIVVYLLLRQETRGKPADPVLLATLLSWTFFVKPTYVASIVPVAVFILCCHRPLFPRFVLSGAAWLAGFLVYSWSNIGSFFPRYYAASRLRADSFWTAMAGNLVSPSRGFLVFCPFLLFVVYLLFRYRRHIAVPRLLMVGIGSCVLNLIIVSGLPHWWGGHSYGPRLLTSMLPWVMLISMLGLKAMIDSWGQTVPGYDGRMSLLPSADKLKLAAGGVLLAVSIFINVNGALSRETLSWNTVPENVDIDPSRVWSWSYPQFLAAFLTPPYRHRYAPYEVGRRLDFTTKDVEEYLSGGWSFAEPAFRWTDGQNAELSFSAAGVNAAVLRAQFWPFLFRDLKQQRVDVLINDKRLSTLFVSDPAPRVYTVNIPPGLLKRENVIRFRCVDAAAPKSCGMSQDPRKLALAFQWLSIEGW